MAPSPSPPRPASRARTALALASLLVLSCTLPEGFLVVGPASLPEYPGSGATDVVPMIVTSLDFDGRQLEVRGPEARLDLWADPNWQFGPVLGVTFERGDDVESEIVGRLPEVELAVEGGAFLGYVEPLGLVEEDSLQTRITLRGDTGNAHGGYHVTGETEYFVVAARMLRFGLSLNATYASEDYMDAYFSVDEAGAAASGLGPFQASEGLVGVGAALNTILSFDETWGIFSRVTYNRLQGDAASSPIVREVGDEDQWFMGVGLFWRF